MCAKVVLDRRYCRCHLNFLIVVVRVYFDGDLNLKLSVVVVSGWS